MNPLSDLEKMIDWCDYIFQFEQEERKKACTKLQEFVAKIIQIKQIQLDQSRLF